jgi:hypothetical protein
MHSITKPPSPAALALTAVLAAAAMASPAAAQTGVSVPPAAAPKPPAPAPRLWRGSALANASVFFGNNQQQVLGADGKLARVDSNFAFAGELQAQYGEASVDGGPRTVTKRLWLGTVTVNYRPLAPVSSFLTTTFESNLEKRIAARYSLGAGAQWNAVRDAATQASLSLSLSAERTLPLDTTVHLPAERLARFSWLGKLHHAFDDRMEIAHATSWQPTTTGGYQFLISSTTELRYKMNGTVSLSLAFNDNYDSGALARGARTYNDGQMLFGVAAGW